MKLNLALVLFLQVCQLGAQDWMQLGDGFLDVNGTVNTLYYDSENDLLYAGGDFIDASQNEITSRIAVWNGEDWTKLGCGFQWDCDEKEVPNPWQSPVLDIIKFQDTLYVCGAFSFSGQNALSNVAKWNGEEWLSVGNGVNDIAKQFEIIDDQLYVVGRFNESPGHSSLAGFAQWNGVGWEDPTNLEPPDTFQPQSINCIEQYQGGIYLGGNLTINGWESDLIRWNGLNWEEVPGHIFGTISTIEDLATFQQSLFVAGNYTSEYVGQWRNSISAWDGTSWENLDLGVRFQEDLNAPGHVRDIAAFDDGVMVVGTFAYAGDIASDHVAWWNGQHWCGYGSDDLQFIANVPIYAVEMIGNGPVIGGYFHEIGGEEIRKVAKYVGEEPCLISEIPEQIFATISAVVIGSVLRIMSDVAFEKIEVYDLTGRQVKVSSFDPCNSHELDLSDLAGGIYIVHSRSISMQQKVYLN